MKTTGFDHIRQEYGLQQKPEETLPIIENQQPKPDKITDDPELEAEVELIERARKIQDIGEKLAKMIMENPTKEELLAFLNDESHWTTFNEYANNPRLQEILSEEVGPGKRWSILIKDYDTKRNFILIANEFKKEIESIITEKLQEKSETEKPLVFCSLESFKKRAIEKEFQNIFTKIYQEITNSTDYVSGDLMCLFKSMSNFFTVSVNKNKVKITITTSEIRLEVENTHHEIRKYTLEEIKKFIKDKQILKRISEEIENKFKIPVQINIKYKK
ncbi:MAG: hypothetical protein ACD_18C00211G0005 [uncultured bacterium]|nr:MAG: hypothetical protein ACD_18C00211G0005 [uncultured bacterium]OGH90728.1 MAG: hypothetical protein A2507_02350 [Candidatus Magasanikbacteria bacterium RIFOXYD12_FULL_33_17]HAO52464.1 hypothetical protein [Candidatus Magasanikbacteria bacterium]